MGLLRQNEEKHAPSGVLLFFCRQHKLMQYTAPDASATPVFNITSGQPINPGWYPIFFFGASGLTGAVGYQNQFCHTVHLLRKREAALSDNPVI